jgi:hypothetical protein
MKVFKHTKIVELECWNCGIESHTHRTEEVALRCVEKQSKGAKKDVRDRNCEITLRVLYGQSFASLASEFNISITTVQKAFKYVIRHTQKIDKLINGKLSEIHNQCYSIYEYRKKRVFFIYLVRKLKRYWETGIITSTLKPESGVELLDLSVRTLNVLRCKCINTIADLIKHSEYSLLKEPNMGKKSVEELKLELKVHGLELKR